LGHAADQTDASNASKLVQGRASMLIVDSDRALAARESGLYSSVQLKLLKPPDCTPKNHLLVAVAKDEGQENDHEEKR